MIHYIGSFLFLGTVPPVSDDCSDLTVDHSTVTDESSGYKMTGSSALSQQYTAESAMKQSGSSFIGDTGAAEVKLTLNMTDRDVTINMINMEVYSADDVIISFHYKATHSAYQSQV